MTTYTPILNIPQVATNQNNKETTINTGLAILEAAMNDSKTYDFTSASVTLTVDDYTRYFMFRCTNNTVARNLDTPALVTGFTGKRFFVVSNEGTATITVRPSGSGSGTISVLAGKIALIQNDGTSLRAVSQGVALLQDLSDIDFATPPGLGDVLLYNGTDWVPGAGSATNFLGLADTPDDYTGKAAFTVTVNGTEDGLEFTEIVSDSPAFSIVNASMVLTVKVDGTGLEWASVMAAGAPALTDLSDVDGGSSPSTGQVIYWDNAVSLWKFKSLAFIGQSDTPANYTGAGKNILRVNSGATALEFIEIPTPISIAVSGKPVAGQIINIPLTDVWILPTSLPGSQFFIGTNPTATATFTLYRVVSGTPTSIGTVVFSTSGVPTVTFVSTITFSGGDLFRIVCPSPLDATAADIGLSFRGARN